MARARQLSDRQLDILRVLWQAEEATVAEVQEALQSERKVALTTVATILSRLEARGVVRRRTAGRQFIYSAAIGEQDVRRSMVSALMDRLFAGDPSALVHHLIDEGRIDAEELARLEALLARQEGSGDDL